MEGRTSTVVPHGATGSLDVLKNSLLTLGNMDGFVVQDPWRAMLDQTCPQDGMKQCGTRDCPVQTVHMIDMLSINSHDWTSHKDCSLCNMTLVTMGLNSQIF